MKKPAPLFTYEEARHYALGLLSRRDRTSHELSEKFKTRAVPADIQSKVLEFLAAKGFINDQRSADAFVASRRRMGWGPTRIRAAFHKRGLAGQIGERALAEEFGGAEEAKSALDLLRGKKRRFIGTEAKPTPKGPEKALSFLLRRGFSYSSSRLAVQKVFSYNPELPEDGEN